MVMPKREPKLRALPLMGCPLHLPSRKRSSPAETRKMFPLCDWAALAALYSACDGGFPQYPPPRALFGAGRDEDGGGVVFATSHLGKTAAAGRGTFDVELGSVVAVPRRKHDVPVLSVVPQTPVPSTVAALSPSASTLSPDEVHKLGPRVKIVVYYETLCPDSRSFIATQLTPVVNSLPLEILDITMVPYGKATTVGHVFECQHGPLECEGNKVHACAIAHNRHRDSRGLVHYINCMIHNNRKPLEIGKRCNEELDYGGWDDIQACATGEEGSELLAKYGEMTHALNPSVDFIPTVIVDGNRADMWKALKDLKGTICDKYPFAPMERKQYC